MAGLKDYIEKNELPKKEDKKKTPAIVSSFKGHQQRQRISATVDPEKYALFTQINKVRGLTNNGALNLMIAEYILEHENLLEE